MGQFYSDRNREKDRFSLPDTEVFWVDADEWAYDQNGERCDPPTEGELEKAERGESADITPCEAGWYYWHCFPGCLPDSEPIGPFDTEGEAMADARENAGDELEEGDDNADD